MTYGVNTARVASPRGPPGWPSRPARTRATRAPLDAGVSNARSRMPSHDGHPRTPVAGAVSTVALANELAGPSAGAVMGTRPAGSWGKSPFGRMGGLHYRTCVRVQGEVPPVVPV